MSGILRPARQPSADEEATVSVREVCEAADQHPSGLPATYVSGLHRHPDLWQPWRDHHARHGFVAKEDQ